MNRNLVKPVSDPYDDIDRVSPVDSLMARQDRADLPGNRSDQPGNEENDPDRNELGAEPGPVDPDEPLGDETADLLADGDIDADLGLTLDERGAPPGVGPDDDEPIEQTERMGDDSATAPD